ncbi:MAG: SHOCT domain-containing protein [Caldilineaceae bacterium]
MAITTKECNYEDLRPHLVRLIERHRIEDDPVLYCCDVSAAPNHWLGYLWGNPEPYDYAHAITLHKIISARRSKIYHSIGSVSSLDLVDVVVIEPAFDPRYGHMVAVHSVDMGVLQCPISQAAQAKLIAELEAAVAAARSSAEQEPPPAQSQEETTAAVADRLQRLDELLATGIITADEHQQRRQAILAEL